jgi:hypothetical protein
MLKQRKNNNNKQNEQQTSSRGIRSNSFRFRCKSNNGVNSTTGIICTALTPKALLIGDIVVIADVVVDVVDVVVAVVVSSPRANFSSCAPRDEFGDECATE